jgi:hypothetical protein
MLQQLAATPIRRLGPLASDTTAFPPVSLVRNFSLLFPAGAGFPSVDSYK